MPELTIEAGAEPEKIIPELQAGQEFNLEHLGGGPVHVDHNFRDVKADPQRVATAGDEGPIRSPDVADVWAYAPETDADIRVSRKGFIWDLFSNKATERPTDRAGRLGYDSRGALKSFGRDVTVPAGGTPSYAIIGSVDADGQRMVASSARITRNYDPSVSYKVTIEDAAANVVHQVMGHADSWPYQYEDTPTVPVDGAVVFRINNPTGNEIDVEFEHVRIVQ